jgi:hypothetical protein
VRVRLGLQQAGHDDGLEVLHLVGGRLQADVLAVNLGEVAVLRPPAALLSLARHRQQGLAQLGLGDAVLAEQRAERGALDADPAGLDPSQGAGRDLDDPGGALGGHLGLVAQPAELGAELPAHPPSELFDRFIGWTH